MDGVKGDDICGPNANMRGSMHHWAEHGIAGRGVLLDYRSYANGKGLNYGIIPTPPIFQNM